MLTVEEACDYVRMTGYPDESDWLSGPERPSIQGYGVAGPRTSGVSTRRAAVCSSITRPGRRTSATMELGAFQKLGASIAITVSSDMLPTLSCSNRQRCGPLCCFWGCRPPALG